MALYIFCALQNKGMIMNYNNLKILLKRIPKAQVPLIKSQLGTQNTISFLNSPSSTELVMFYWCIISGRRTNLISCHQGLKSCSGSSSKERVFLEGCPDTLSLLYYRPYSSFSQSNYSDKSLKELTALPGKMEPQVSSSSPSSWILFLLELVIVMLTTIFLLLHVKNWVFLSTSSLLSAKDISYTFLRTATFFHIILQLFHMWIHAPSLLLVLMESYPNF